MSDHSTLPDVYAELGVTPIINASGYVTRNGGSLMLPEVAQAMVAASRQFVSIAELQQAAGRVIAEVTGAQSGYVTSGAAAGLTLAAAALLAGDDRERINRLPDTSGIPNRILIPGTHRDSYDRCFRIAGAQVSSVGTPQRCTANDLAAVLDASDDVIAVGWFSMYAEQGPSLESVVTVAHAHDVAVIVDAAVAFPPPENLRRFIAIGADIVAFSAGKDLRGPQTAGFLAGRADLMQSIALQQQDFAANDGRWDTDAPLLSPGHGLGRPMKVGREELVGALTALRMYPTRDHAGEIAAQQRAVGIIAAAAQEYPLVRVETGQAQTPGHFVRLTFTDDAQAVRLMHLLAEGTPRILAAKSALNPPASVMLGTATLQPGEAELIAERLHELLADGLA